MGAAGLYRRTGPTSAVRVTLGGSVTTTTPSNTGGGDPAPPAALAHDWSETNLPYVAPSEQWITATWPTNTTIVPIQTASTDFWTNLNATLNAASAYTTRAVVRLLPGVTYLLKSFRMIGSSGDPNYAFGFWFQKLLQGFLCCGPDGIRTADDLAIIRMAARVMTDAQVDRLAGRTPDPKDGKYFTLANFKANQMGLCRLDSDGTTPILIAGIRWQADDQNPLDAVASDIPITTPQPAPHQGPIIYPGSKYDIGYCLFEASGAAATSQPPFEHACISIAKSSGVLHHSELDGRRAAALDPNRRHACSTIMLNNEIKSVVSDCWGHDSNVSRYAANDQNVITPTPLTTSYDVTRTRWSKITTNKNDGRGGYTNASLFGYESSNARITHTDVIYDIDDANIDGQAQCAVQFTAVGSVNQRGGRFTQIRPTFRHSQIPALDGWGTVRCPDTSSWASDGYATTMDAAGRTAWVYTGAWTQAGISAAMAAAGVKKDTNYVLRKS